MTRRVFALIFVALIAIVLLYMSRFWIFDLWGRSGLFGLRSLRPQGGLLGQWLRGTPLAPFELLIWACAAFGILTLAQKLWDRFGKGPE